MTAVMGHASGVRRQARRVASHEPLITSRGSRITDHAFLASCLVFLAALAGCAGTPSPKTNYYTLSVEEPGPRADESAASRGPAVARVAVTRVVIPGIVDRPQMVARTTANRVEIFDFHRWAEPLQDAAARVIAGDLGRDLGSRYAVSTGVLPGLPPDLRVTVDVQKFAATLGSGVAVEALWTVRPGAGEARVGRSVVEEQAADGHAGIAAAYSRALAAVSRDIAAAVSAATAAQARDR